ncbi:hypothetical protein ACL9RF_05420 [Sphingobacterium sp. Mn56C]|uniref:hypothetical protein n=1 Tax=Sphingobacterium sp. Mn56C TaxID=3395261 RepID=UPI003BDB4FD3
MKKIYNSPSIVVFNVLLEEGIAAGSASVRPQDMNNEVYEQWIDDGTETKDLDWSKF